jgi:hypothetical protein
VYPSSSPLYFVSSPHTSTFSFTFHSNPYSTSRSDEGGGQRHDHGHHEDEADAAPNASFAAGYRPVPIVQTLNHSPSAPHAAAFNVSLHIFPAVVSVGLLRLGIDYLLPVGQHPPCTSLPFLPSVLPRVSSLRTMLASVEPHSAKDPSCPESNLRRQDLS